MSNWQNISLYKFQQIEEVNNREISQLDKTLFATCIVFDKTEHEFDNLSLPKKQKMVSEVNKLFEKPFNPAPMDTIGDYKIDYDPSKLTLGQYIELCHFLQKPFPNVHKVLASIVSADADTHQERAEYFWTQPITKVLGSFTLFCERFQQFNNQYTSLFGQSDDTGQEDWFSKKWGWFYSAEQVAIYERVTLDEAYALPIRRALNSLIYLKNKARYEVELSKRK